MHDQDIAFQLVPPGTHRRNAADRVIRTFKNHFIAALCSLDKNFPLHLWDRLIPQAVLALNLLRGSRINPKLSVWAQINEPYDYNATPIAPPGIRVVVYEPPSQRGSWAAHGENGWYVGPSFDHYHCYRVWIRDTKRERFCDTLEWFPTKVTMSLASSTDLVMASIQDIIHALHNPSANSLLAPPTGSEVSILHQLTDLLLNRRHDSKADAVVTTNTSASPHSPAPSLRVDDPSPPLRVAPHEITSPPPPIQEPPPAITFADSNGARLCQHRRRQRTQTPTTPGSPAATTPTRRGRRQAQAYQQTRQETHSRNARANTRTRGNTTSQLPPTLDASQVQPRHQYPTR
jgi:hypothetical protein